MTATKEAIAQVLNGVIDPNTGKGLQDSVKSLPFSPERSSLSSVTRQKARLN